MTSQPMGTAIHTNWMPNRGARVTASTTRRPRFTRLATVNMVMSPAPRRTPSEIILRPISA